MHGWYCGWEAGLTHAVTVPSVVKNLAKRRCMKMHDPGISGQLDAIIQVLDGAHGLDISPYDKAFLAKSLEKRLTATGIKTAAAYGEYLGEHRAEADALFESLSIAYSVFFRDPLTFALIEQVILPSLVAAAEIAGRGEIRVWSAGCAAGQEAYSVAILLDELATVRCNPVAFRIFATDRSEAELAAARKGVYDVAAVQNVRLKHILGCFSTKGDSCKISSRIKDRVDFSSHDLLDERSASPSASIYGDFSLILCGNLLFYYRPEIRQRILNKVCRALSPGGYLVTGEAEGDIVARQRGLRAVTPSAVVFQKRGDA